MSEISQNIEKERRVAPRVRALKKGVIAFQNRYCSSECMIKNETENGALLMVSQNHVIPNVFELKVYPESDFRVVEAIWRTPDAMGIRYVDAQVADPAPQNTQSTWEGVERRAPENRRKADRRS